MPEYRDARSAAAARAADAAPGPATPVRLSICTLPTLSLNTQTPLSQPTSVIASVTASVTTAVTAATISVSNAIRSDLHSTYNGRLSARAVRRAAASTCRCAHMPTRPHADVRGGGGTTDQRSPMARWLGVSHQPARSRPCSRRGARGSAVHPPRNPFGHPCRSSAASRAARWPQPARSSAGSRRCQ